MSTKVLYNTELNGIEIYFSEKPEKTIINNLKENGFRWSGYKSCWYAKQSEKTIKIANEYIGEQKEQPEQVTEKTEKSIKKEQKTLSLWDATTWKEIKVDNKQSVKEIAAEIRKYVKSRFPQCKFSITSDYIHDSMNFYITASPYEKDSIYLKAIKDYCTNLLKAYNYCTCYDPYGDYGSSYNFYGAYAEIYYDYTQTEQTEAIKVDMQDFDNKKVEFEKSEEERQEKEFHEQERERDEKEKQRLLWVEEEKRQTAIINNNITIKNLTEQEQYFIIGSQFAKLNKNQTLDEYKEEVKKGNYDLQNVKVTKEIHFNSIDALNYFSNMLLNDFDFLTGTGGSYTDDNRINSMTDYYSMTKEEQETVKFNLYGVAIYFNNKLQFVVDAEGYSYARYIGLTDNATIQKSLVTKQTINNKEVEELKNKVDILQDLSIKVITNKNILNTWDNENFADYKDMIKDSFKNNSFKLTKAIIQQIPEEAEKLKVAMYKVLTEVDGIQDQFKNANLQQGQKITIFHISDFGSVTTNRAIFDEVQYTSYAQYDNAVKVIYTPQHKKNKYYNYYHDEMLVYNGWLELPEDILNTVTETGTGITITQTKYLSYDKQQYDEILNYFKEQGLKPIINTYKPDFD